MLYKIYHWYRHQQTDWTNFESSPVSVQSQYVPIIPILLYTFMIIFKITKNIINSN